MPCDPNTLLNDARCFDCLTEDQRAIINLSLLCQIAGQSTPVEPSTLLNGLIAYWNMDEASSITRQDSHSGNLDLTVGGPVGVPAGVGIISNAASFDGAASPNTNYLTNGANWNMPGAFAITCWVKMNSLAATQSIIGPYTKVIPATPDGWQIVFLTGSNQFAFVSADSGSAAQDQAVNLTPIVVGTWYFVSVNFDGATAAIRVNNADEVADGSLQANAAGLPLLVGTDVTNSRPLNGLVDEVGIWSRNLTDIELATLYNGGSGRTYPFS